MTEWDRRAFARALGAALLALAVVWLVTAASDEGALTVSARTGRTLPIAPFCSAAAAVLALGTRRVREEARALEALGRSPAQTTRAVAFGAALPSIAIAMLIALHPRVDVGSFYPRATAGDVFVWAEESFVSPTLGIRVTPNGEATRLDAEQRVATEGLPRFARGAAALATAISGTGLALVAAEATLRPSLLDRRRRRRRTTIALVSALGSAFLTLLAFQAAAAKLAPAALALLPPAILFVAVVLWRRSQHSRA